MATPRKCLPQSSSSEVRLHVAGMDCADEAALIRHALAKPGIDSLNFDLVGRRVDVRFDAQVISEQAILAAVTATGLAAHPHHAGEVVGDDHHGHDHHHDQAWWWTMASGAVFAIGWIIDGIYAETWSEAIFGGHGGNALQHSHNIIKKICFHHLSIKKMMKPTI
jgi:cation transport ATPase